MFDESNIEDVEQSETNDEVTSLTAEPPETLEEAGFENFGIGDADTAEGQARRAEEAHLEEVNGDKVGEEDEDGILEDIKSEFEELEEEVEDLPPLPSAEEAEMGELCRVPSEGQFQFCELVDEDTPDLIGVLEEEEPKGATDQEVREAIEEVEEDDVEDITEGVSILEEIESEFEDLTGGEN